MPSFIDPAAPTRWSLGGLGKLCGVHACRNGATDIRDTVASRSISCSLLYSFFAPAIPLANPTSDPYCPWAIACHFFKTSYLSMMACRSHLIQKWTPPITYSPVKGAFAALPSLYRYVPPLLRRWL